MTPPSAVLFDIGNVLVRWDPDRLYERLLPDPEARAALFRTVPLDAMNLAVDRGAPLGEAVEETARAHPAHAHLIRPWAERWLEMFGPAIDGSWRAHAALRAAGVPVHALSNFGAESLALAETRYPGLRAFDRRFISAELGTVKPEPRIFEIVEEALGLAGPALFFTDDRADNIAAAAARGWRTHLFDGPDGLWAALRAEGLGPALDAGAEPG